MRKRGQSGFALLLVFLMAAVIAITLYLQIPRVAFQAQRQKEQLLIERGEQYKRAIQLFYRANNRYPAELKDLENFNNRRFLRHKFLDPMTGKDDWRLVHVNNGILTDSVLNKKKDDASQPASTAGQYVGEQAPIGATLNPGQPNLNPILTRRRASEGGASAPAIGPDGQPVSPFQPGQPMSVAPPAFPGEPQSQPYPGTQPFSAGQPDPAAQQQIYPGVPQTVYPVAQPQPFPGAQPFPGSVGNAQPTAGAPIPPELANLPGGPNVPGQVPLPGRQPFPGLPSDGLVPGRQVPGGPQNSQPQSQPYVGGGQPYVGSSQPYVGGGSYIGSQPTPANPGAPPSPFTPGFNNPAPNPLPPNFPATPGGPQAPGGISQPAAGPNPAMGPNPAAGYINNLLTSPRPNPAGAQPQGQQIGGGIAGVASKAETPSIMVYNDRTNYNEWEFIFDPAKQAMLQNPNAATVGTPVQNLGTSPAGPGPGAGPGGPGIGGGLGNPGFGAGPGPAGFAGPGAPPAPGGGANPGAAGPGQSLQLPTNIRPGRP